MFEHIVRIWKEGLVWNQNPQQRRQQEVGKIKQEEKKQENMERKMKRRIRKVRGCGRGIEKR